MAPKGDTFLYWGTHLWDHTCFLLEYFVSIYQGDTSVPFQHCGRHPSELKPRQEYLGEVLPGGAVSTV